MWPRNPPGISRYEFGRQHVSAISDTASAPIAIHVRPPLPQLGAIVVRAMVSLTMAVIAPTALFAATLVTFDVMAAVTVALLG